MKGSIIEDTSICSIKKIDQCSFYEVKTKSFVALRMLQHHSERNSIWKWKKNTNILLKEIIFNSSIMLVMNSIVIYRIVAPICRKTSLKPNILKSTPSPVPNISTEKENRIPSCITEEWEQLVILDDDESTKSPSMNLKSEATNSKFLSQSKPMDEKTTRILERLEPPKPKRQQKKDTLAAPVNGVAGQMKRPLLPFDPNSNWNPTQSQPMKPNFQRMKKKQKT